LTVHQTVISVMEGPMRARRRAAAILFTTLLIAPLSQAVPQDVDNERGGVPTETQQRMKGGFDYDFLWNALGLLGLVGLLGLHKGHDEDGYHPSSFE
jgi:hypothetical protein